MTSSSPAKTPLTRRFMLAYSTGDLGISIPGAILSFYQLYFLTDVALLRPELAAWAVAAGRVWDAINDPLFGILSDRINSKHGRRRVLLLFGAVPLGLSFVLMWLVPDLSQGWLAVYYAVTFMLYDTSLTAVHVGYNALTPELTQDYDERSTLNGYRMFFSIVGTLGAIIAATLLSDVIEDPRQLYMILGLGLGAVSVIPPMVVFRVTRNYRSNAVGEKMPAWESIKTTVTNKPFQKLMGLYLFSWTTASVLAAGLVYFARYYLMMPDHANYLVLVAQSSAIAFLPVTVWLARKFDKRLAFMLGNLSWLTVLLVFFFFIRPEHLTFTYILAVLLGLGIATAYVIPWSMIPDIIEDDELATGHRREGSYYTFAAFFQKLGTGIALWGMGLALAATGYDPTLTVQPDTATFAIRVFMGLAPVLLVLVAMAFAWGYPISREYHQDLLEQLAAQD